MRASSSALVVAAIALASLIGLVACDRHEPLVICHNANCLGPDTSRDDTLPALQESLLLTHGGVPALDGMEIDTFWYGKDSRCLFAHDLVGKTDTPATEAADVIAQFLETHARASWNGERFYFFIELKAHVGPDYSDAHTPTQLVDHADCVLDVAERVLVGARAGGHLVTFAFVSGLPHHLEVLTAQPRWATLSSEPDVELMLVGDIFAPYSSIVPAIADFEHLDAVEYHPDFMTLQHRETYRSLDIDLVQWSFVATSEAFAAIQRWEPRFAITNEGTLLRRWAEN